MNLNSDHLRILCTMLFVFAIWTCARMSIFYEDHFEKKRK
jgi:hypothetical protein